MGNISKIAQEIYLINNLLNSKEFSAISSEKFGKSEFKKLEKTLEKFNEILKNEIDKKAQE